MTAWQKRSIHIAFHLLALGLATISQAKGKAASKTLSAEELFRRFSPAVVKVEIKQQGIPIAIGAGFFISKDGSLITNHHVMRGALGDSGMSAEFTLNDRRVVRKFKVAGCSDDHNIDLCLLQLDVKPKAFFPIRDHQAVPGEAVYVIGHPQGLDFSISNGIVSAVRISNMGVREVQISAAISPGNSGGPIFNDRAELVGVATKYLAAGQNLNFGILSGEIEKYRSGHRHFFSKSTAHSQLASRLRTEMRKRFTKELEPVLQDAMKSKSLDRAATLKEVSFDFADEVLRLRLPKIFEGCARAVGAMANSGETTVHACFALGEAVAFSVQRYKLEEKGDLLRRSGTVLLPPKSLALVEALQQDGNWGEISKGLKPEQKADFESKPSPARCQKLPALTASSSIFSQAPVCRFNVANDQEPGAYSVNLWIEFKDDLYAFAVWMNDPSLAEYFSQVPLLAALSARRTRHENTVAKTERTSEP